MLKSNRELNNLTAKQLARYIANYGKTVNTRLTELEKNGYAESSVAFRYITEKDPHRGEFVTKSKSGYTKISLKTKGLTRNKLLSKATTIQGFLNAKTSTITGTKKAYNKALNTFNEKNSTKLSAAEYKDLVTHDKWKDASKKFGSDQILDIVTEYSFDKAMKILDKLDKFRTIRQMNKYAEKIAKKEKFESDNMNEKFESDNVNENPFE